MNPNFTFHVALSEPLPEDAWTSHTGFIHEVLLRSISPRTATRRRSSTICAARCRWCAQQCKAHRTRRAPVTNCLGRVLTCRGEAFLPTSHVTVRRGMRRDVGRGASPGNACPTTALPHAQLHPPVQHLDLFHIPFCAELRQRLVRNFRHQVGGKPVLAMDSTTSISTPSCAVSRPVMFRFCSWTMPYASRSAVMFIFPFAKSTFRFWAVTPCSAALPPAIDSAMSASVMMTRCRSTVGDGIGVRVAGGRVAVGLGVAVRVGTCVGVAVAITRRCSRGDERRRRGSRRRLCRDLRRGEGRRQRRSRRRGRGRLMVGGVGRGRHDRSAAWVAVGATVGGVVAVGTTTDLGGVGRGSARWSAAWSRSARRSAAWSQWARP